MQQCCSGYVFKSGLRSHKGHFMHLVLSSVGVTLGAKNIFCNTRQQCDLLQWLTIYSRMRFPSSSPRQMQSALRTAALLRFKKKKGQTIYLHFSTSSHCGEHFCKKEISAFIKCTYQNNVVGKSWVHIMPTSRRPTKQQENLRNEQ